MPVIRTFRKEDPQIEDYEEIFAPEVFPVFSSFDYETGIPDALEVSEEEEVKPEKETILSTASFWRRFFVVKKK